MEINKRLRAAKYGYMILSVFLCMLGIVLIAKPGFSVQLLCRIGGVLLILFGCVRIGGYVSNDLYRLAFQFDLGFGIFLMVLGVILLLWTDVMITMAAVLLGIFILADALMKLQISVDAKAFGIPAWWMILTAAVITGAVGFLILLRPWVGSAAVMILTGVALLSEGILNLITMLVAVKVLQKKAPWQDRSGML